MSADKERIAELESRDSDAAKYVEAIICMRTHFTGNPPYVGWKGLGLALTETLDKNAARIAELEREAFDYELCNNLQAQSICELSGELDEAERKLAEQQALLMRVCKIYQLEEKTLIHAATEELNNLLAKVKEDGRKESMQLCADLCDQFAVRGMNSKDCANAIRMLLTAPKP